MDIKAEVEKIVKKIKGDKNLLSKFQKDPVATVKELAGSAIPDSAMDEAVKLVKSGVGGGSIIDKVKSLF